MKKSKFVYFLIIFFIPFALLNADEQVLKELGVILKRKERPKLPVIQHDEKIKVRLKALGEKSQKSVFSFGLPLPPHQLENQKLLRVVDSEGQEIPIHTKVLCHWTLDQARGSIRSILIQGEVEWKGSLEKVITVELGQKSTRHRPFTAISETTFKQKVDPKSSKAMAFEYDSPKVLCCISPEWLSKSLLVWQQVPVSQNTIAPWFDQHMLEQFPRSKTYISSKHYSDHLFDRTATYVKMYVRHGTEDHLLSAIQHADFYDQHQAEDGFFDLKQRKDHKYVYTEGPALMYMLTGDERYAKSIYKSLKAWDTHLQIYYTGSGFWTERHHAFGMMAHLHAYELTGVSKYLDIAAKYFDAAYQLQVNPKDGKKPNGAWLRSSGSAKQKNRYWFTVTWMSAFMVDAIWKYWMLSGDERAPQSLALYAKFLSNHAVNEDGTRFYHYATSPDRGKGRNPELAYHSMEAVYMLSLGYYLSGGEDKKMLEQIQTLYPPILKDQANNPGRKFNWRFRETSMLIWFLEQSST